MECMNASAGGSEAYMPYEEVEKVIGMAITKPLGQYTLEEARNLVEFTIQWWAALCKRRAGITNYNVPGTPPDWFSHESSYLDTCVKQADPKNLVRSVVDCFVRQCVEELPF